MTAEENIFKTDRECLEEMSKHQPVGCVREKHFPHRYFNLIALCGGRIKVEDDLVESLTFKDAYDILLFADGKKFCSHR